MTALLADLRKALISPNEDFVVMVPLANQDKTRVIGADDLNQIKKQTANVYIDPASIKIQEPVIDDDDEDDDDDIDDEDGDINPKMEKAITIMGIAAGVVIIIIIIYLCITLAGSPDPLPADGAQLGRRALRDGRLHGGDEAKQIIVNF